MSVPRYPPPVIPSHKTSIYEDQIRRAKGELSCVECRRLKLKCDRQIPCSSCVRRSCPDICPNGHTTKSNNNNRAASITARLKQKVNELTQRVHVLEDALAVLQASISKEPHPLLVNQQDDTRVYRQTTSEEDKIIGALGSLTITEDGQTFFGPTGGAEVLFLRVSDSSPIPVIPDHDSSSEVMTKIIQISNLFPFLPGGAWHQEETIYAILDLLPDQNRAWSLCETYVQHATFGHRFVERSEVIHELMAPLYKHMKERDPTGAHSDPLPLTHHQISSLFSVFALGALMDLTLPECNSEAEGYYRLAHACLLMHDIYGSHDLWTVVALGLVATYHSVAAYGIRHTIDLAWRVLSMACSIAHSIGLHRDPAHWGLDPKVVWKRRTLFWELFTFDEYLSLDTGRPPNFSRPYFDCQYPMEDESSSEDDKCSTHDIWSWKYRFMREVHASICELTLQAEPPTYNAVLEVDQKLRDHPLPKYLDPEIVMQATFSAVSLKHVLMMQTRAIATIYLHRNFFVRAMMDHPQDPMRSKYAASYVAASRSASDIIKVTVFSYKIHPALCRRWWTFFIHLFSAAMITGSIVIRTPTSSSAKAAFEDLRTAVDLFSKIINKAPSGRYGKVILERLLKKATRVYNDALNGVSTPKGGHQDASDDAELAIFGGHALVQEVGGKRSKRLSAMQLSSSPDSGGLESHSPSSLLETSSSSPLIMSSMPSPPNNDASSQYQEIIHTATAGTPMGQAQATRALNTMSAFMDYLDATIPPSVNIVPPFPAQQQAPDQAATWDSIAAAAVASEPWPNSSTSLPMPAEAAFFSDPQSLNIGAGLGQNSDLNLIDDRWVMFMRDSGIFDPSTSFEFDSRSV